MEHICGGESVKNSEVGADFTIGRIPIVDVSPVVDGGRWPAKAVLHEAVPITATIFREGHEALGAAVTICQPDGIETRIPLTETNWGLSKYEAHFIPTQLGRHEFWVSAWSDPVETWAQAASKKISAGIDVQLMLDEGVAILERALGESSRTTAGKRLLKQAISSLKDGKRPPEARLAAAWNPHLRDYLKTAPLAEFHTTHRRYSLVVQRPLALRSSWYEIFPRSEGAKLNGRTRKWKSGTFATASTRLPAIAEMGFDVVYLTPIHPIGTTHRKGRNNSLQALPDDPGSPYAIGSAAGGHDAIHPDLGTMADFKKFVRKARNLGLEVALDLALQCSPDHPWVTEHPEWFTKRADGTIAYAENPPKKYQDIYPLNFDNDPEGIYAAVRAVLQTWIDAGVTAFRVDNPHTKPLNFWERLLGEIEVDHPEVIFLSEAFTRPAMMHTLAKIGFHQSYTYFTWRQTADEMATYLQEVSGPASFYMRPNFWPTTHDILTPDMQDGGAPLFAMRAVLAATASPAYGIYTGYEFVENVARPGVEEQIDNEKYEFKPRNWAEADKYGLVTLLTKLNQARRAHPSLLNLRGLTVHRSSNDQILCFSKHLPASLNPSGVPDTVIVVVSFDPHHPQSAMIELDLEALDLSHGQVIPVHDVITGETYQWGQSFYVELGPNRTMAHVAEVRHG